MVVQLPPAQGSVHARVEASDGRGAISKAKPSVPGSIAAFDIEDPGDMNEKIDYANLLNEEEALCMNKTEYTNEEVLAGKIEGLGLLDQFGVYRVEPIGNRNPAKMVGTKWEISWRGGKLKCRLVGREFKWLSDRDDVFAPASTAQTSRIVDYLGLKDDNDPDDPIVTFLIDCTSAFYQAPETE